MVTIADVRSYLKDLPSEFVSDSVIEKHIDVATFIIEKEKSETASTEDIDKATLIYASYQTALAYATELERSLGQLPPPIVSWIELLKEAAEKALEYIRRGFLISIEVPMISNSLYDYARSDV